jgi:hypothetical protein
MHSELAVFDDSLLGLHAETLADLAWQALERHGEASRSLR